jgi:NAD-dependent SIR2 family protein deacetylase
MKGFFSKLKPGQFRHLENYLSNRCDSPDDANVEAVLLAVEQMEDCPLPPRLRHSILGGQDPKKIREELEKYCIQRLDFAELEADHWPVDLLAHADHRTTVITTNYDTVAEQILSARIHATHCGSAATCHHCNMRAILAEDCQCDLSTPPRPVGGGHAPLLKIHGSIAWHSCCNSACRIQDCLVASCDCSPSRLPKCNCCGDPCKPVIVLPSMKKSFAQHPQLGRMWERAHYALSRCTTLTIFGFSFPESDCLICDVFRDAFKAAKGLKDIVIIDIVPELVAKRVAALLPPSSTVTIVCCSAPTDGSVPTWWTSAAAA